MGAVGKYGSLSVLERLFRTLKGAELMNEFTAILDDYVERRYGGEGDGTDPGSSGAAGGDKPGSGGAG